MAGQAVIRETGATEQQYVAYRDEVMALLHSSFAGLSDLEELYQEAWAEVLEKQARGHAIHDVGALLWTIAWRRGCDRMRKQQAIAHDPTSHALVGRVDSRALPDETVEVGVDAAVIWQVVDSLEPRQAAVIKMRFGRHMSSREIQQELGVSSKRLEKIVTRAYSQVEEALASDEGEEPQWRRRQRSLLLACELRLASAAQRRQAKRMVREDPACRAMLAEIRSTLEGAAAILPLPLVTAEATGRLNRVRLEIVDRIAAARDQIVEWFSRAPQHVSSIEQASAGGAASVGGGLALKATLTCVAVTGTAVVCVTGGVIDTNPAKPVRGQASAPERQTKPKAAPLRIEQARVTAPVAIKKPKRATKPEPVARAAAPPPPSPAPPESTEFGPGTVGSSSPAPVPAAAPTTGSGEFTP